MTVAELNELAVAALKRAMRATGVEGNAAAFTRLLRGQAGDGPDPTTVGRWLRSEQTVPAWALLAASRTSEIAPTDLLLPDDDLSSLHRVVEALQGAVAELRSPTTTTASGSAQEVIEGLDSKLVQLADIVRRLQDTVETQGQLLDKVAKEVLQPRADLRRPEAPTPESPARGRAPS